MCSSEGAEIAESVIVTRLRTEKVKGSITDRGKRFVFQNAQTNSGSHQIYCSVDAGVISWG
jgi:hypothetical protein